MERNESNQPKQDSNPLKPDPKAEAQRKMEETFYWHIVTGTPFF